MNCAPESSNFQFGCLCRLPALSNGVGSVCLAKAFNAGLLQIFNAFDVAILPNLVVHLMPLGGEQARKSRGRQGRSSRNDPTQQPLVRRRWVRPADHVDNDEEKEVRGRRARQKDDRTTDDPGGGKIEARNQVARKDRGMGIRPDGLIREPLLTTESLIRTETQRVGRVSNKESLSKVKNLVDIVPELKENSKIIRGRRRRIAKPSVETKPRQRNISPQHHIISHPGIVDARLDSLFKHVCSLDQNGIENNSHLINTIVERELISRIEQLDKRFTFEILHTGSYYEKLKVRKANEFDIMVKMKANTLSRCFKVAVCPSRRLDKRLLGFAYLQYRGHREAEWGEFLVVPPSGEGRVFSPEKLVHHFRNLISQCLSKFIKSKYGVKFNEPVLQGPAVTVGFVWKKNQISVDIVLCIGVPEWPSNAQRWGAFYRRWPSRRMVDDIKSKGCHVVPKTNPHDSKCWRLSFSVAEKSLLSPKGINEDKKYYRIFKYIFEIYKRYLEPLCSYHLKTLFLHLRSEGKLNRAICGIQKIICFFEQLILRVEANLLLHFFIPDLNLFYRFSERDIYNIKSCLDRILMRLKTTDSAIDFIEELMCGETV